MIAKQFDEDTMILMVDKREHELLEWALSERASYWRSFASISSVKNQRLGAMNAMLQAEEYEDLEDQMPKWESYE